MRLLPFVFALAACSGAEDTEPNIDVDTDTDTDTEAPCVALVAGQWAGYGPAFGMRMNVTLTPTDCSFTLTEWDMVMDTVPDAGTVDGDEATLGGDDPYWASCVGAVDADGTRIDGACADDGAAFVLESDP